MPDVAAVQDWLDALHGSYTIQKMKNGEVLFALTSGTVSVSIIRPTFVEAAAACILSMATTARRLA